MFSRIFGKPKQEANTLTTLDKLNETLEMLEKKEKVLLKKAGAEVERAKEFTRAKNKRAAIQCLKRKRLYEQQVEQLGNFQLRIHDQMIMLEGAKATTETVDALRTGAAAMKAMQKATYIAISMFKFLFIYFVDILIHILFACYYMHVLKPEKVCHIFLMWKMFSMYVIFTVQHSCLSLVTDCDIVELQYYIFRNIDDVDKTMDEINEQTENMKQIQEALSAPIGSAADFDEDELEAELEELEGAELEEQLLQPATTAPAAQVHVPAGRQPTRPAHAKPTPEEDELAALQAEMAL
ncbi:hypothetical protein RYX36_033393 [Vicia faba]